MQRGSAYLSAGVGGGGLWFAEHVSLAVIRCGVPGFFALCGETRTPQTTEHEAAESGSLFGD